MKKKGQGEDAGKEKTGDNYQGKYFLGVVVLLYLFLFLIRPENTWKSLKASADMLIHILPVLLLVILFMATVNHFINPKTVSKYVGTGSGIKGWLISISTGILSHGPIYVWYPLLRDLRNQGMQSGLIAVFLYNRAIKIPLLPLMAYYFGAPFAAILTAFIILASIVQGWIIQIIQK